MSEADSRIDVLEAIDACKPADWQETQVIQCDLLRRARDEIVALRARADAPINEPMLTVRLNEWLGYQAPDTQQAMRKVRAEALEDAAALCEQIGTPPVLANRIRALKDDNRRYISDEDIIKANTNADADAN